MITTNKRYQYFNGELNQTCKVFCKSTDTKPTAPPEPEPVEEG